MGDFAKLAGQKRRTPASEGSGSGLTYSDLRHTSNRLMMELDGEPPCQCKACRKFLGRKLGARHG